MTSKHEHKDCEHELKHCNQCDVVECTKCGKEWVCKPLLTVSDTIYVATPDIQFDYTTTPHEHTCCAVV